MSAFRLFHDETNMCSFSDYAAILETVRRYESPRVLEFGPGSSTLAIVEGGASLIDCCEDSEEWLQIYRERILQPHVAFHRYHWSDPVCVPTIPDYARYDLGVVDGPFDTSRRPAVIRWCLQRCTHVLVPLECAGGDERLGLFVESLNVDAIELMHTGPLAGMFALLTV